MSNPVFGCLAVSQAPSPALLWLVGLHLQHLAKLRRRTRPVILKEAHHSHVGSGVEIVAIQSHDGPEFAFGRSEIVDRSASSAFCRCAWISPALERSA